MENNRRKPWQKRGLMAMISKENHSDVLGSYTGTPADEEDDVPVQDADDL